MCGRRVHVAVAGRVEPVCSFGTKSGVQTQDATMIACWSGPSTTLCLYCRIIVALEVVVRAGERRPGLAAVSGVIL